jgi:copper chaperone CopZ
MNKVLNIPAISCGHCLKSIERELGFVEGVEYLDGDADARVVHVEYREDSDLQNARKILADIGFATDD